MRTSTTTSTIPYATSTQVADAAPLPDQALARVWTPSVNRGEVTRLPRRPESSLTGWDAAGVTERATWVGREHGREEKHQRQEATHDDDQARDHHPAW